METKKIKLKWTVGSKPSGLFRVTDKRRWPSAEYKKSGKSAALIYCDDAYYPSAAKSGDHAPLTVRVADYSAPPGFKWRTLKHRPATLKEAKELALNALLALHHFIPDEEKED